MILSSLCEFYNKVLVPKGTILPEGYSRQTVHYQVCLTPDGKIDDIVSLATSVSDDESDVADKKAKSRIEYPERIFPYRSQKSAIDVNIPEHRPKYLFGLEFTKNGFEETDKAKKSFGAFRKTTLEIFEGTRDSPLISAYCEFVRTWNPSEEKENPQLAKVGKNLNNSYFEFVLSGHPDKRLQDDEVLKGIWDAEYMARQGAELVKVEKAQCSVYGEVLPIARVHDKIKIPGGASTGCTFVCVNNSSEESYGKEQGTNCRVSVGAMKEYTAALNYLLQTDGYHIKIGDTTFVYFALAKAEEEATYQELLNMLLNKDIEGFKNKSGDARELEDDAKGSISSVFKKIRRGQYTGFDISDADKIEYCVFGLIPNVSRISVRYAYRNTFGTIYDNVVRYHEDFGGDGAPSFWEIGRELDSPNVNGRGTHVPPDTAESLLKAMIQGTKFPRKIYEGVLNRIKTDSDTDTNHHLKFNTVRDGIVRACLNRNYYKENGIGMALNTENKSSAYLCGRLFAVLEKIQKDSSGGELNKTITDAYFSSACTRPATVFPRLLTLSQNHIAKLSEGTQVFYNNLLNEIFDGIADVFPRTLTLEEQGEFVIGYRHQNKKLYESKTEKQEG
ncbi:MAG: type I-C CRISPR-associated protein Cas8c/Csd1 [Bacteroidales bacterium]|nr:type I-C CRISPR-associated protein Cas8c/Csd1 [Bacteroidales bacterium]